MNTIKRLMLGVGLLALSAGAAAAVPAVVQTDLNLRSGPGPRYAAVAALPAGATVDVGGCTGSWCVVNFEGAQGYANRAYLGMGSAAVEPGDDTYAYGWDNGDYDPGYYDDYGYYGDYGYGPAFGFGFGGRGHRHDHDGHHDRGPRVGTAGNPGAFAPRNGAAATFAPRTGATTQAGPQVRAGANMSVGHAMSGTVGAGGRIGGASAAGGHIGGGMGGHGRH